MIKILLFLTIVFGVNLAFCQNYPDIDRTLNYEKADFSEIDELIAENQPNKAIVKLLIVQIQAISEGNLLNLSEAYDRLRETVPNSGKENEDIQKLFKEQHKLFLTTTGVTRNFSGKRMSDWLEDYRIRRCFSFDEESIEWPISYMSSKVIELENRDIKPLKELYEKAIFENEEGLMRIPSALLFDSSEIKYQPTLFDVFAQHKLAEEIYSRRNDTCYWQSTEEFSALELTSMYRLQAKLESLNKQYGRWDAYAFCLEFRISNCDKQDKDAEYFDLLREFQSSLLAYPASNRFAYRRAIMYASEADNSYWRMRFADQDGFLKSLKIIDEALKLHPKSDFTEELEDLKKKILQSSLTFSFDDTRIPSDHKLMTVNYRNITSAYFAIYHVTCDLQKNTNSIANPLQRFETKLIQSKTLRFDEDPNRLSHNKDFIIEDLDESGVYMVVSAPNKDALHAAFKAEKLNDDYKVHIEVFQLSNLLVREKNENAGKGILVNNAKTGKPIKDAVIKIEPANKYREGGISSIGKTDKNGYFMLPCARRCDYSIYKGDDSLNNSVYIYSYNRQAGPSYVLFTDRSIYRPGQVVHYKTLSYQDDLRDSKILSQRQVKIRFVDNNGQELYSNTTNCNEFGSTSGSFVLPKSGFPLGNVAVYINGVYVDGLNVEEYKRPTFEVIFDKPEGRVVLGAPFTMKGKVMAYAGYPLSNAEVTVAVSENRYFPYWCFVMEGSKNYDTTIVLTTDKDGIFQFEYTSDKPKDAYGVYYSFEAKAVDVSGEVQTANHSLYLGKTSYSIRANIKDKYRTDENPMASFSVMNSQGEDQKNVEVKYEITRKKANKWYTKSESESEFKDFSRKEFERSFPRIQYYTDQNDEYLKVKTGTVKSDEEFSLQSLSPGTYVLHSSLVDEVGDTIVDTQNFIVWDPKKKRNQHFDEFWTESEDVKPAINEPVNLYVGSSFRKSRLLIAKYNVDGLISMEYMKLKRRRKIEVNIDEANKEGIGVYSSIVKEGEVYSTSTDFTPIDSSKILKLKLKLIHEPLRPGTKQSWEIELSQNDTVIKNAELLASMYDASLDAFSAHYWRTGLLSTHFINSYWDNTNPQRQITTAQRWNRPYFGDVQFPVLMAGYRSFSGTYDVSYSYAAKSESNPILADEYMANSLPTDQLVADPEGTDERKKAEESPKSIRENFNETAFFEPQIRVSSDGKYKWNFTLPDALTRWKLMSFAHTQDFKTVYHEQTFLARKELMLETFEPRFWRKGDSLVWMGKVVNLSEKEQSVEVSLKIQNLIDESDVSNQFGAFEKQIIVLQPNESKAVEWPIVVSDNCPTLVRFEAEASTEEFADVVRKNMPILEGKERITLAQNFSISEKGTHDLYIKDLENVSKDAEILSYSVSVQTQPLWSTMLSLTKVLEPKNELNESYFNQYFGASLAKKILLENREMKQALKAWQIGSDDALTSLLEQNEELKALLLNETPWVLDAKGDTEQLRRLAQLLDDDYLSKIIADSWLKVKELQLADGAWSWVGKARPNWYVTQYICNGLTQLSEWGIPIESEFILKANAALEAEYKSRFAKLTAKDKEKGYGLGPMEVEWLYIQQVTGYDESEASKYYSSLLSKKWQQFGYSTQSIIGLIALKSNDRVLAKRIMASFQDKATSKVELGKYWNGNSNGYGWYENKIETQTKMIQFYQKYGDMNESVAVMQKWLLQQKRTQLWDTEKSTVMACYVLKDFGNKDAQQTSSLSFGNEETIMISDATPFDKKAPERVDLTVAKTGAKLTTSSDALVFASAQVVYTDKAESISKTTGDFRVERNYYILENGKEIAISDERQLLVGDIIKVKLKLVSDRDLDFVHLEDPKASGWEPTQVLSGYRYQNGYYYQSNRDSKTDFFIENLRKGTYIYEYDLKITVKGSLQVGPAKATCYYAPSFGANTKGERFVIGK